MLKPLEQWICDHCDDVIERPSDGYVIWNRSSERGDHSFKVIHHVKCDHHDHSSSLPLRECVGAGGLSKLLSFWSAGPIMRHLGQSQSDSIEDDDEFVDLVRRLHVPYYEEARQHFTDEQLLSDLSDANKYYPYRPDVLQRVAEDYDRHKA